MRTRDSLLLVTLALALPACGSGNAPRLEKERPPAAKADAAAPKTNETAAKPTAAATRWLWIEGSGGTHLAYYYVDPTAGPSAKGAVVGDSPTKAEIEAATGSPTNTFRDPIAMGARGLTQAEVDAMHLPARPPWLDIFEPVGAPPPEPLVLAAHGRKPSSISKELQGTAGADPSGSGTADLMLVQDGCSRFGKSFIELVGGDDAIIGTDKPQRGKLPAEHDIQPPIRVRIRNEAKTIHFEALDPKRLPLVDGKPMEKGELELGDTITIGNRVFAIAGPEQERAIESPTKGCAELGMK